MLYPQVIRKFTVLEAVLLAVVILIAAYLRMGQPGIVEYKRDEANLSQLALDLAREGSVPLLGIGSSVGIPNAPLNVYILAIPYWFDTSPLYATQFIGFLNVLAVGLTYWLARQYVHPYAALLAAFIFAVSPWSIIFSRKIWAQNMLPPFVVLTVYTGILGFTKRRRWAQVLHLPLLAVVGQIHYGAFVMIPVSVYLIWTGRRQITGLFIVSIVLAILLTLPYLAGMIGAGFNNLGVLQGQLEGSDTRSFALSNAAIHGAALMIAGTEIHSLTGPERFEEYLAAVPDVYPLLGGLSWLVVFSSAWLIVRVVRQRDSRTPVDVVLLIWLLFPIFVYSVTWTEFYIHYLIPIFPAAFLILGFALHDLWYSALNIRRVLVFSVTVGIGVLLVLQLWLWLALLDFVDQHDTPDGFGTPLHYLLEVREAILEANPQQVLASLGEQALIYDNEPTVWNTLLYDVPTMRFTDEVTHVYPAEAAVYLSNDCTIGGVRFTLREGKGCYLVSSRSLNDLNLDEFIPIEEARFANGVQLVSYHWDDSCLSLVWQIMNVTGDDYQFAVHFVNEQDEQLASGDGISWYSRYWRPGDLVVRDFCLPEAIPEIGGVYIGMYTLDGSMFNNIDLLDSQNQPAGQSVKLSLPQPEA